MPDESLWSSRNIAEYAYCPRLFYLMEVEGINPPSADTEEGLAIHKHVNKPSVTKKTKPPPDPTPDTGQPTILRSFTLTSRATNITAALDIAELTGTTVVPVEYRKGRPRRVSMTPPPEEPDDATEPPLTYPEPWPTDKIQIALQSILLEEAGYTVTEGILYYSSEKLRLRITIDDTIKQEALSVFEQAKQCAAGPRPLPLVNDPKCPRCSLQPVCLPDEINLQRTHAATEELPPRKIWPPRDDGIHIIAQQQGIKIGITGEALKVTDKEGITTSETPIINIESLSLLGNVQITTQAVHTLALHNIPIAYLTATGRLIAMIDPLDAVSAQVLRAQILGFESTYIRLHITRELIASKIINQRTILMRNHPSLPPHIPHELKIEADNAAHARDIDTLRGHEGRAAVIYFQHFPGIFKNEPAHEFAANGRQRRPPPDPINACLSFAYTLLAHECTTALRIAGLNPSIGAYHTYRPGRPALSLDLMEPFRPLIADSLTIALFNRAELKNSDFRRTAAGCILSDTARKTFFNAYGRRMNTDITHPIFEYRLSYRRMLTLHSRMIAAYLMGEINNLNFLTTR